MPQYGWFLDRLGGLVLDSLILVAVSVPIIAASQLVAFGARQAWEADDCGGPIQLRGGVVFPETIEACEAVPTWFFVGLSILTQLAILAAWWRIVLTRMSAYGGSPGMRAGRLEILGLDERGAPHSRITSWRAFGRSMLSGLLPALIVAIPVWALVASELPLDAGGGMATLWLGLVFLYLVPWLWALVDPRRQTLYDKLARTVVVGPPGRPEPCSELALAFALLGVFPLGIVLGHVGLHRVGQVTHQRPGRGAAVAALWVSYLTLAALIATIGLTLGVISGGMAAGDRDEQASLERACVVESRTVRTAVAAFEVDHGRAPADEDELVATGYLAEASDAFEVIAAFGDAVVVVEPGGDCEGVLDPD